MGETDTSLVEKSCPGLLARFETAVEGVVDCRGTACVQVKPESLRDVVAFCKQDPSPAFNCMMDLFGMDYLKYSAPQPERFAVVYNLYSIGRGARVLLKVYLAESALGPAVDSIHDIYAAANWFEREAWDLFGIVFNGHPNLTRILCHAEFVGHPLRRDYPADQYQRLKNPVSSTGI